uniref:Uncharacterized protein n=1 Tax=Anguilla anguilla TaxID=7936 RepID=A0A0E9WKI7_ANGAN
MFVRQCLYQANTRPGIKTLKREKMLISLENIQKQIALFINCGLGCLCEENQKERKTKREVLSVGHHPWCPMCLRLPNVPI